MQINRYIKLENILEEGKVVSVFGPRQCGKTFIVKSFLDNYKGKYIFETGTLRNVQFKFIDGPTKSIIEEYGEKYDLVVFDEAQLIPNIGEAMKALVDLYPKIKVILTGSSSFDLAGQIGEPLFGRQKTINLFPVWEKEILNSNINTTLSDRLFYGSYPEVLTKTTNTDKIEKLSEYSGASLFKDILAYDKLKKPFVLVNLVKMLAFQIGQEVSVTKLSKELGVDQKTVERYMNILEKTFVIFKLSAYVKNIGNEIKKKKKYYFYDLGIRNSMIGDFNDLLTRNDIGGLWENFCVIERLKRNNYLKNWAQPFFWRTTDGEEIDYLEYKNENIEAFEFKWSENKKVKDKKIFKENYKNVTIKTINKENYRDFIL